jgi:hypothetical protein
VQFRGRLPGVRDITPRRRHSRDKTPSEWRHFFLFINKERFDMTVTSIFAPLSADIGRENIETLSEAVLCCRRLAANAGGTALLRLIFLGPNPRGSMTAMPQ